MMGVPTVENHNPDPAYLRGLVSQIGLSQREVARRLGVNETQFRKYLTPRYRKSHRAAPYLVQYALEAWAAVVGGTR